MRLSGRTPEVPLVAFASLVHLRISFALFVLGGAGRGKDGGIDNATFAQHQAILFLTLVLVHGFGEGQLIHGGVESYAIGDGTILADFGELFRGSLPRK